MYVRDDGQTTGGIYELALDGSDPEGKLRARAAGQQAQLRAGLLAAVRQQRRLASGATASRTCSGNCPARRRAKKATRASA